MKVEPSLQIGDNRTGLSSAVERRAMLAPPEDPPTARGSALELAAVRVRYAQVSEPAGTMPRLAGARAALLPVLDLLGGRLAVARLLVRLAEGLLAARHASSTPAGGPADGELAMLRDDHRQTARLVEGLLAELGADPTAVTPSASRDLLAYRGVAEIVHDPRTSLLDALEAVRIVELAEHERWVSLIELARSSGLDDLVHLFASAQTAQQHHVSWLRGWSSAGWDAARREAAGGRAGRADRA